MRRLWGLIGLVAAAVSLGSLAVQGQSLRGKQVEAEDYIRDPMPPGFQVITVDLEGPVFADAGGKTLYFWPINGLRNGYAGDRKGTPTCDDTVYRVNAGLQSPYPGGLTMPDADTRPSCVQMWPPAYAPNDAKEVGKWSVLERKDGRKQWAYDGYSLYTSALDKKTGDVLGATKRRYGGNGLVVGARRQPAGPDPNVPPQFAVNHIDSGRILVMAATDQSVYVSDKDTATKANCDMRCRQEFQPVLAPEHVRAQGDWSTIESSPGVKQWTYRGRPLYTRPSDRIAHSHDGGDVPGWHNVWTQREPPAPKGFTVQSNRAGQVLADAKGRTIYLYNCNDDAVDQQDCSHPSHSQVFRLAISGKGDQQRAMKNFPYVLAGADAESNSPVWTVITIDSATGRKTEAGKEGALRVWAYRDRPVYTCALDQAAGDIECDSWGENVGLANGYRAFWLRDDFGGHHG